MIEVSLQPERDQPHVQTFNLGVLGVGDIVRLNMALHFEEGHQYDLDVDAGRFPNDQENFRLLNMLREDILQLAAEDLDRTKEIVTALKSDRSEINKGRGYSQMTAVECASA